MLWSCYVLSLLYTLCLFNSTVLSIQKSKYTKNKLIWRDHTSWVWFITTFKWTSAHKTVRITTSAHLSLCSPTHQSWAASQQTQPAGPWVCRHQWPRCQPDWVWLASPHPPAHRLLSVHVRGAAIVSKHHNYYSKYHTTFFCQCMSGEQSLCLDITTITPNITLLPMTYTNMVRWHYQCSISLDYTQTRYAHLNCLITPILSIQKFHVTPNL